MESSQTNPFPKSGVDGNLVRSDVGQATERVKAATAQAIDCTADTTASAFDEAAAKRKQLRTSQWRLMGNTAKCMHSYPLTTTGLAFDASSLISRLLGYSND